MGWKLSRSRDTGGRDLNSLVTGLMAGSVRFQSKDGWNLLELGDARFDIEGTSHNLFPSASPLAEFAPLIGGVSGKGFVTEVNTSRTYRVAVNYLGDATVYGAPTGAVLNGSVVWPMNRPMPPPTAFPGGEL